MKRQARINSQAKPDAQREVVLTEQYAIKVFYNPQVAKEFSNRVTQDQKLINSVKSLLKKGIRDIINATEEDLLERGFLQGSVLFKPVLDNIADLVIVAGSKQNFSAHFLTYYAHDRNIRKFGDEELINFYNTIIDLWTQNKVNQKVDVVNLKDQKPTLPKNSKRQSSNENQKQKIKKSSKKIQQERDRKTAQPNKRSISPMIDEKDEIKPPEPNKEKLIISPERNEKDEKKIFQVEQFQQNQEKSSSGNYIFNDIIEQLAWDEEDWKSDHGEFWSKQPEDATSQGWQMFKQFTEGIIKPNPKNHNSQKCTINRVSMKVIDYGQGNLKFSYYDSLLNQLTRVLLTPSLEKESINGEQETQQRPAQETSSLSSAGHSSRHESKADKGS